jgi:hypothetical protein
MMFEYLDNATIQNAFPAGHHAIQIIRKQWAYSIQNRNKTGLKEGLNSPQDELVKRIIQDIETAEGKPVAELSSFTIDMYINIIVERIEQLSRQELNVNQSVGKNLLNQLRAGDVDSLKK